MRFDEKSMCPSGAARTAAGRLAVSHRSFRAAAALIALALAGCDKGPRPPIAPVLPQGDSPEAKLERVMDRFEFALDSAEGAREFGVVSTRRSHHRLIPPSANEPRPTAEVTVETTVALSSEQRQEAAAAANGLDEEEAPAEPTTEKETFLLVYEDGRWHLPKQPESETLQLCFESALRDE